MGQRPSLEVYTIRLRELRYREGERVFRAMGERMVRTGNMYSRNYLCSNRRSDTLHGTEK